MGTLSPRTCTRLVFESDFTSLGRSRHYMALAALQASPTSSRKTIVEFSCDCPVGPISLAFVLRLCVKPPGAISPVIDVPYAVECPDRRTLDSGVSSGLRGELAPAPLRSGPSLWL